MEIREQKLGKDDPSTQTSMNNLAMLYQAQGKYAEAEPLYKEVLTFREKTLGKDHKDTVAARQNLADIKDLQNPKLQQWKREAEKAIVLIEKDKIDEVLTITDELIRQVKSDFMDKGIVAVKLYNLGNAYRNKTMYGKAVECLELCLKIEEQLFGTDSVEVATDLNQLAVVYKDKDEYDKAVPLCKRALEIREQMLGNEDPSTLRSMCCLALLYQAQGKYAEAEPLYKETLKISEQKFSKEHLSTLTYMNNLASLYQAQGKYAEAESLYKETLKISEQKFSKEHLSTLTYMNNLAELYRVQGKYAEAESLYKETLKISEQKFSKEHLSTLTYMNNLAELYRVQGKYAEAEPLYKETLKIREQKLGKEHQNTQISMNNLALLYKAQGKYTEAESIFKETINISERTLDKENPNRLSFMNNLALLYQAQGKYVEAELLLKKTLKISEQKLEKDNPSILTSMNNLALLYHHQGKYAEAEPLYKETLNIREQKFGKEHPDTLTSMNNLAGLYNSQGKYAEAEPLLKETLEISEQKLGKEHPDTLGSMNNLAMLYKAQGKYAEAEPLLKEILEISERKLGKEHPDTLNFINNLAGLYSAQGNYTAAEPLYKETLKIRERTLGKDHPSTLISMNNLAMLYDDQGKYAEAETLYSRLITAIEQGADLSMEFRTTCYGNRALCYLDSNLPEKAFADFKKGIEFSRQARKTAAVSDETRAKMFAENYYLYVNMVKLQQKYLHDMNEVYLAMEMSRAQGLQDLMDAGHTDLFAHMDKTMADKLHKEDIDANTELKEKSKIADVALEAVGRFRTEKKIEGDTIPANLQDEFNKLNDDWKAKSQEVLKARQRVAASLDAIRSESPAFRDILGKDRLPVAFEKVQKALEQSKTIAMEYILGDKDSFLFVYGAGYSEPKVFSLTINKEQADILGIGEGNLTVERCEKLFLDDNGQFAYQETDIDKKELSPETLKKLYTLWSILVPNQEIANIAFAQERILLLPDAALTKVPFEMLVIEKPTTGKPKYLLDASPATLYSPAASIWYNLTLRKKNTTTSILTLGNPLYDKVTKEGTSWGVQNQLNYLNIKDFEILPFSKVESNTIKERSVLKNFDCSQLLSGDATEGLLKKNVSGKSIVHLACHGIADNRNGGAFAAMVLSPGESADNQDDDGFLTFSEMFGLDLHSCNLAILSACETNAGANQRGEGTWSICRGFQTSGATNVVTTEWSVNDEAGTILISQFTNDAMNSPNDGQTAQKLQKARRLLRSGKLNPEWEHPYYWAPFILMGP